MKRPKVFLGLTTAVLAIVGVAAAKRFTTAVRYYVTTGNTWCTKFVTPCVQTIPANGVACTIQFAAGPFVIHRQLYTKGTSGTFPDQNQNGRCTTELLYRNTEQ